MVKVVSALDRLKKRLPDAVRSARERQKGYRRKVKQITEQYIGGNYTTESPLDRTPVNMLKLMHDIIKRALVARTPKVRVQTDRPELMPTASELELAMDFLLEKIQFGTTMQRVVQNAFFGTGISKTGVCGDYGVFYGSRAHFSEVPFFDSVHLDDWVHDPKARSWEAITWCGNSYIESTYGLEASGLFSEEDIKKLSIKYDEQLTEDGATRVSAASTPPRAGELDITEFYEFWDIWVPGEGKILTMQLEGTDIIREVDWDGPPGGPFDILGFGMVPDNVFPLSPGASMLDLHLLVNEVYRKLGRQALRQKTITAVQSGSDEDGKRIRDSEDGEMIRVDNPQNVKEISFGGPDNVSLAFGIHVKDVFSYMSGNLDVLGGLSPQADTATQENLLNEASNKMLADMQDETVNFTKRRVRDLAWFLWSDRNVQIPIVKRGAYDEAVMFDESRKSGDFFDYNFDIHPYSMRELSPAQKLALINQAVDRAAMLAPFLQMNGQTIDTIPLFEEMAKVADSPIIRQIIRYAGQSERMAVGSEDMPDLKPAATKRTYERINRPGAVRSQKDQALISNMLGGKNQPSENTMARATG